MNSRDSQENIPPNSQHDEDELSTMDYGLLIELVSKYPILYDMSSKDYKNIQMKDSCWQQIGQAMGQSAADCLARWLKLKDCHRREKNKRAAESKSGSGATTRKGFAFYQHMNFVENCPNKRKSHTNVSSTHAPAPAKKQYSGYQIMPPHSSMSTPSLLLHDFAQLYTGMTGPTATSVTPIESNDAATLATESFLTIPNASQTVSSFFQSPSTISATPESHASLTTDLSVASLISPAASQNQGAPLPTSSATLLSEALSIPTPSPSTAKVMPISSNSVCETFCKTASPYLTPPTTEMMNQGTIPTITFALPEECREFLTPSASPVPNSISNVARRYSGGQIATPPTLTSNLSKTPTPTSNYSYCESPSTSVCLSPGPVSPASSSCSFNFDTPKKACFDKDNPKTKKIDPLEASFMSLSTAMQNRIKNSARVEPEKSLNSDQIFGNLIAAELANIAGDQKIKKKARILEILFEKD